MTKTRTRTGQENRTSDFKIFVTKIRDWLGFFFTVAGFCLSLSGTIHINIQTQFNTVIVIEVYNYIPKVDEVQWKPEDYLLNMKGAIDNTKKNNTGEKKYPTEWAYINLTECSYDMPKRKKQKYRQFRY